VATVIGCLPTQALAFLAVLVYATHATHATQAIAFEWKPGLTHRAKPSVTAVVFNAPQDSCSI